MTEHRSSSCSLVPVDNHLSADILVRVSTLAERVGWIIDNRRRADGSTWTDRGLSDAAGLSPAHIGMIRRGDAKKVTAETIEAIARVGGVSAGWLAFGLGTPDSDDVQSVSDSHRPQLQNLPGWAEAERLARQEHADWPEWVWAETAQSSPFEAPVVTVGLVLDVARLVMRHRPPPAAAARRVEQAATIEAKVKAFAETGEMGKPPPPDPEPKRGRRR